MADPLAGTFNEGGCDSAVAFVPSFREMGPYPSTGEEWMKFNPPPLTHTALVKIRLKIYPHPVIPRVADSFDHRKPKDFSDFESPGSLRSEVCESAQRKDV